MTNSLLSINNYYYRRGGAEAVFLEHNALFENFGWRVVPFAMRHSRNFPSDWDKYFIQEIEFGEAYSLTQKLLRAPKIIYSFEAQRKIRQIVELINPQIAHAHNIYHHISPSIFSTLRKCGIPTVLTLHDLKIACPAYKMLTHDGVCERCKNGNISNVIRHRCIKNSLSLSALIFLETGMHRLLGSYSKNVTRFVVPSQFYLDKFIEWGWDKEKFTYIPNFVDLDSHTPSHKAGNTFMYIGRLGPEKGLTTFIQAAAISKTPAIIVGTGPEEDKLHKLANEVGADVTFTGYQSGAALHDLVRSSRAVVLPSEWYENAPISILEAYALGRPVIGSNIGGIPELIRPGETGAVFESGNSDALASVLEDFSIMTDSKVIAMGHCGREWVEREFSAQRYRDRMLALYDDISIE